MAPYQTKPFLKWAGGKSQLVEQLAGIFPYGLGKTLTRYCEPFVGGGAVLFDILSKYKMEEVYISDSNAELINMYKMVREHVDEVIEKLQAYETAFLPLPDADRREFYYQKRDEYNELIKNGTSKEGVLSASLFIFINRTCFNGLYRANTQGLFNVPMGVHRRPTICNVDALKYASDALKGVIIQCADYSSSEDFIDDKTFVYLDPPYRPLKDRDSFVAYTEKPFNDDSQRELAEFMKRISQKGAFFVLSNSDPKNADPEDNFFDDLYSDFTIQRISAERRINSKAHNRGGINELVVFNYPLDRPVQLDMGLEGVHETQEDS